MHLAAATTAGCCLMAIHASDGAAPRIEARFPGGNIIVERMAGSTLFLRPDLRDTTRDWFYWQFAVHGAEGRALEFRFATDAFGSRGPAMSRDGGQSWSWLGTNACRGWSFHHTFGAVDAEVRFAFAIPYVQSNLDAFLKTVAADAHCRVETLTRSEKDRPVEWLRFGRLDGGATRRVLLTCRHHACETMASFALEGIVRGVLGQGAAAEWLRAQVEFSAVPFMDKDGVEAGDQGKLRRPHDHWLDYGGESRYASVRALRERFAKQPVHLALDLHCPHRRDETIYLATSPNRAMAEHTKRFSELLEKLRQGPLRYRAVDNLIFGTGWNRPGEYGELRSFMHWAETLKDIEVVATVELPYAAVNDVTVTPENAAAFGRDLVAAIHAYLLNTN